MEDPGCGALARRVLAQRAPEHPGDLVRPPGLVPVAQLEDADDDLLAGGERARKRATALLDEARYPCAGKRRSHLWPVCREMPYSLQSAEMFAPIALAFSMN